MTTAHDERANMSNRDELIKEAATAAAQRVDAESVGLDPVTIITILTQVLPTIIACFRKNDESTPSEVQDAVRHACRKPASKNRLRFRMMKQIRGQSDQPLTKEQAYQMADALIAETLQQNPQMVAAVAGSVLPGVEM